MAIALKIGSRPSALALAQTAIVRDLLVKAIPQLAVEVISIRTTGDRLTSGSLANVGGKGLFIKELEQALERREIDLAVHSMKDLPATLAPQFRIAAVPAREDPRDALLSRTGATIEALEDRASVGTSSVRRRLFALRHNPKLNVVPLRGNIDTRLKRVEEGALDAIIIAMAGLKRLGRTSALRVSEIDVADFIPAGGQGALCVEARAEGRAGGSAEVEHALTTITDARARYEVSAERAFLATIGASCVTPVGVHGVVRDAAFSLRAILFSADGTREIADAVEDVTDADLAASAATGVGVRLGERMLAHGAGALVGDG
ncbi:MAG: hydroxymethylbilane synthase [Candidatus Binataceae bacterium]